MKVVKYQSKFHAKYKNLYKFATTLYKGEDYNIAVTIIPERSRMQFSAELSVSNDTPQRTTQRNDVDTAISDTDTTTRRKSAPHAPTVNTNIQHENSSIASKINSLFISQMFRVDLSDFSEAFDKCLEEYIAEYY